ncbi:GAF domain-containing sensor histidine kinase [Catenovulum sediminis]|uniref:histidine kinase n=1 Tax=Catenovulum sediminis TaxID=1740262 RepID=A0ABV1RGA5_9ALTE
MIVAPPCGNEDARLATLFSYDVLDTPAESAYDDLVSLASHICDKPIALISLIDARRQWFKAKVGLDATHTSKNIAFCSHAILQDDILEVPDTLEDERFFDNPLVTSEPKIRFYAGAPLITKQGYTLGTLCVIDKKPAKLSLDQKEALSALARQTVSQLELRLNNRKLDIANKQKNKLLQILSHDLRTAFGNIINLADMLQLIEKEQQQKTKHNYNTQHFLSLILRSSKLGLSLLENLLSWSLITDSEQLLHKKPLNVRAIMMEAINYLATNAKNKSLTVKTDFKQDAIFYSQENLFRSVIQNLLHNAIKFSPEGKDIWLLANELEGKLIITVADQGIGMSKEDCALLFGSGVTAKKGTAGEQGSGLGAQIIRDYVREHRGEIEVHSAVNNGTEITISLPLSNN